VVAFSEASSLERDLVDQQPKRGQRAVGGFGGRPEHADAT
jgi:hypothetical protein